MKTQSQAGEEENGKNNHYQYQLQLQKESRHYQKRTRMGEPRNEIEKEQNVNERKLEDTRNDVEY